MLMLMDFVGKMYLVIDDGYGRLGGLGIGGGLMVIGLLGYGGVLGNLG